MAQVQIIIRKNKPLKDGSFPLVIRMAYLHHTSKRIRIKGMSCIENEWNKELSRFTRKKDNYKALNLELAEKERLIDSIVEQLEVSNSFSYQNFKDKYLGVDKVDYSVSNGYKRKIKELTQLNKLGTVAFYESSWASINKYVKNNNLVFDDVTFQFLNKYIHSKLVDGVKSNSIAVYLKGLRAIHMQHCKENNLPLPTVYSRIKIQSLIKPTRKRSLTADQLKQLINYKPKTQHEQLAVDVFMFSFNCRGINLMDIAKLTNKNIIDGRIEYKRSKTSGLFSIAITPQIEAILNKYTNTPNSALLPIIKNSSISFRENVKNYNKTLNKILRRIAKEVNIQDLTLYFSRHTYAQLSREAGIGIELISQALGHADLKTTEIYLKSFDNSDLDNITDTILTKLNSPDDEV